MLKAELLADSRCALGEGVQWNEADGRVYWTDIFGDALFSCTETGEDLKKTALAGGLCSFAFTPDQHMLAAFTDGVYWMEPKSGAREKAHPYLPEYDHCRMNDGMLDRQGRFVVGGINEEAMAATTPVWLMDPLGPRTIIENIGCANSIAFSPDGRTMYFADTPTSEIWKFDYDTATGEPSNRRLFAHLGASEGKPDGSCVDAEGGLWNARFSGSSVQRYLPDGTEDLYIKLDIRDVTCCCIGGSNMNRLFITTASIALNDEERKKQPTAGGLFYVDLPVIGLPHGTYTENK